MMRASWLGGGAFLGLILLTTAAPAAAAEAVEGALGPDDLLLVTNARVPEGRALAGFYAKQRGVPAGRIVELDLPATEEMAHEAYEARLAEPLRQHLREAGLTERVRCLVTFYGVPLRVAARPEAPGEAEERVAVERERARLAEEVARQVLKLEDQAREADPRFRTTDASQTPDALARRADAALRTLALHADRLPDPKARLQKLKETVEAMHALGGPAAVLKVFPAAAPATRPARGAGDAATTGPAATAPAADEPPSPQEQVRQAAELAAALHRRVHEPEARAQLRLLARRAFGQLGLLRVLTGHALYLRPGNTVAAVDSELAMLHWPIYGRADWHPNPLHHSVARQGVGPRTLMVARLDAPQSGIVQQMILASIKAERQGLAGKVVLDSRNIAAEGEAGKPGGYGWYDQTLRDLAALVKAKTALPMVVEDSPEVLPPRSADGVALYCGWYSLRNYTRPVTLVPGAVAFHVASFELVSLRGENETGWCAGLLNDGAAVTLGPVAEPYLAAFPRADEFFPLLMTGKLTLAEVYWKTVPMTSWQMTLIGDPLYRPYAAKPALKVEDLPEGLRGTVAE